MKSRTLPSRVRVLIIVLSGLVIAVVTLVYGFSFLPPGEQPPPDHTTGILVGTNPANQGLHPAWTTDAWQVASAAGQSGARVVTDRFGPGPGSSDVMFNAPLISTDGQNRLVRQAQMEHAEDEMVAAFDRGQATALPGPTDLISSIQKMADHLSELDTENPDVIIFGDAVQTAGSVNLASWRTTVGNDPCGWWTAR